MSTPVSRRRQPRRLALLALGMLAALLAACSGSASAPSVPSVPSVSGSPGASAAASPEANASQDPQDAMLAYAKCMRGHGIDFPDPKPATGGGAGVVALPGNMNSSTFQAADKACQSFLPNGGVADPAANQKFQDQMLAYSKCMRDHGVDFPDPKFDTSGGMSAVAVGGNLDPGAPAFQAANKACGSNLPGGGGSTVTIGGSAGGAPVTQP